MNYVSPVRATNGVAVTPADYIRRETLERIKHFLLGPGAYIDLKGMCERVSDSYRDRVVLELLQNAHDAHDRHRGDGRIKIILDPEEGEFGTLCVANGGYGFTSDNFDGICGPSRTTKTISDAIGNKGVGFLSVFQVSSHPEVYSRSGPTSTGFDGFCFRFADDEAIRSLISSADLGASAEQVLAGMPRLYLVSPSVEIPREVGALGRNGFATVVRLPLKSAEALASVTKQLDELSVGAPVQLFLTRIEELVLEVRGRPSTPVRLTRRAEVVVASADLQLMRVRCGTERFLMAQRALPEERVRSVIEADVASGHLPEAWLAWQGDAVISLAVADRGSPVAGRLYTFLPMGKDAAAPLAGHLDAPFCASIDRLRLQSGVDLNALLWQSAKRLALQAAKAARDTLPPDDARGAALDFVMWGGSDRDDMLDLLESEAVAPVLVRGAQDWAAFDRLRVWKGDDFLTPQLVSSLSGLSLVDPSVGTERLARLATFIAGRHDTACTPQERGDAVEAVARDLHQRKRPKHRWNAFYASLAQLFRNEPAELAGRLLLLTARGELAATGDVDDRVTKRKGKRRQRLTAVFLPPLRGTGSARQIAPTLPLAVQRRLDYIDSYLDIAREGSNPVRRFLVSGGLVREHESREILRLLATAMHAPGDVRDPEALRWDALAAMMEIVCAEDTATGVVEELPILMPTRGGWSRATVSYFSDRWTQSSLGLQRMFEEAHGSSAELDLHATRLLAPFADWPVKARDRDAWVTFMRKAGVVDHLRPVPLFSGPPPRPSGNDLINAVIQRASLPAAQSQAWRRLMLSEPALPNPLTNYTATDVLRLPGQSEHAALPFPAARLYALEVIRTLEGHPELARMTIYRPFHQSAPHRRQWPSPVAAFLSIVEWLPLADGSLAETTQAWLPGDVGATPPRLPVVDYAIVSALARLPEACEILRNAGLCTYGEKRYAWQFLKVAGDLVAEGLVPPDAERMLAASREAWQQVLLSVAPAGMSIIGRQQNAIVAIDLTGDGPRLLVADGDDRQMVAASVRSEPNQVVFEPPRTRAGEIGTFLNVHYPKRVIRASGITVVYESGGRALVPTRDTPFVEDELGGALRDVLILSLRYRNSFYHGAIDDVLHKLAAVRIMWVTDLEMRVGGTAMPVPRFSERAVFAPNADAGTILAPAEVRGTQRALGAIAEALGTALGSRRQIGEPLQLFAAQLRPDPLTCTETDYAEVLEISIEEVQGVLRSTRTPLSSLLRTLRPFAQLYGGEAAGLAFAPGGWLTSQDDILRALAAIQPGPPLSAADLLQRARVSDTRSLAISLGVDLAALNDVLAAIGPPYGPIDLTQHHRETLSAFLGRSEPMVRESLRASYLSVFRSGGDLSAYVKAMEAPRPELPGDYGHRSIALTNATMMGWLARWLAAHGATPISEVPRDREALDAVREANMRRLRNLAPKIRLAVLLRGKNGEPLRATYASLATTESALTSAGIRGGWCDFEHLNEDAALGWLSRIGLWPAGWPHSIAQLALSDEEVAEVAKQDEAARVAAVTHRRVIEYSGGGFTVGVDSLGSLSDRIASLLATNSALLATSNRTISGEAPLIRRQSPRDAGADGWGGPSSGNRLSDDEREVLGFFGEAIAFGWLKQRFGKNRVVDQSCWKSGYRRHVADTPGDDGLGYDFAIRNGGTNWFFEVKATKTGEALSRHMIELGSSEIAQAEFCRADRRFRYRILYVLNALHPERAQIFVLPNPRSREGETFYAEPATSGVRLIFPLRK